MPAEKSTRAKTQTLSLRLDPKTRFVLEFIARLNRQSITTVVEEAIRQAGQRERVGQVFDEGRTWQHYWDVSEGVRAMNMLADPDIPSNYEDDELRDFIKQHIEFFSETNEMTAPDRINVGVLWPDIDEYLEFWRQTKRDNPWGTGKMMAESLRNAGVEPPDWPRHSKSPPKPIKTGGSFSQDLDDEIPF